MRSHTHIPGLVGLHYLRTTFLPACQQFSYPVHIVSGFTIRTWSNLCGCVQGIFMIPGAGVLMFLLFWYGLGVLWYSRRQVLHPPARTHARPPYKRPLYTRCLDSLTPSLSVVTLVTVSLCVRVRASVCGCACEYANACVCVCVCVCVSRARVHADDGYMHLCKHILLELARKSSTDRT